MLSSKSQTYGAMAQPVMPYSLLATMAAKTTDQRHSIPARCQASDSKAFG
jgi:hypothetical protein